MSVTEPAIRRALLACLRAAPAASDRLAIETLDQHGWQRLLAEARRQRVSGLVQHRLRERGLASRVPAEIAGALDETAHTAARATLVLHGELAVLLARAAAANLAVLVLKGAHLASAVYRNLALREMGDLDLLVPVNQLAAAATLVEALGYSPYKPLDVETDRQVAQHLTTFVKPGVGAIEIHWTITEPGQAHSIGPAGLWERAVPVTVLGQPATALSPADEILHLCAHSSYSHLFGCGLRSLCDVMMVTADPARAPVWDAVVQRAAEWNWQRGVFLALRLARDLLDARVPAEVLDRLRPDGFDGSLAAMAEDQLFADPADLRKLGAVSELAGPLTLAGRLRHVRDRVFLDPALLASLYGRPATISRAERLWWYAVRASGLLRRASPTVLRFWREPDTPFVSIARGQSRLRGWLAEAGR